MTEEQAVARQDGKRTVPRWFTLGQKAAMLAAGAVGVYVIFLYLRNQPIPNGAAALMFGLVMLSSIGRAAEDWRTGRGNSRLLAAAWIVAICLNCAILVAFLIAINR